MRVAVTGASGHVGANLCRQLLDAGHKVRALVHHNKEALSGLDLDTVTGDVLEPESLYELCENVEVVIHLAAIVSISRSNSKYLFDVNIEGTRNIIRACISKKVRRLIYFSSIDVFNQKPIYETLHEEKPFISGSKFLYRQSKVECEQMIIEQKKNGLEVIVLNPTSIVGPYDFKPSLMGQLIIQLYQRRFPGLVSGGYDWVDVRDVAGAAINAMTKGRNGERYIISGKWRSLKEFADVFEKVSGKKAPLIVFPDFLAKLGVPFLYVDAMIKREKPLYTLDSLAILKEGNQMIDHAKAAKELDYSSRDLEDTFKDTVEWFKLKKHI